MCIPFLAPPVYYDGFHPPKGEKNSPTLQGSLLPTPCKISVPSQRQGWPWVHTPFLSLHRDKELTSKPWKMDEWSWLEHRAISEMSYSSFYKYDQLKQALKIKKKANHKLLTSRIYRTESFVQSISLGYLSSSWAVLVSGWKHREACFSPLCLSVGIVADVVLRSLCPESMPMVSGDSCHHWRLLGCFLLEDSVSELHLWSTGLSVSVRKKQKAPVDENYPVIHFYHNP